MEMTFREWFRTIHGYVFGGAFLLAFSGVLLALASLRPQWLTAESLKKHLTQLKVWVWGMAMVAWGAVLTGTYIIYPWYRTKPPEGATDLTPYARYFLTANEATAKLHEFGMEWKEHVAWLAPIAATVVAYIISVYGAKLGNQPKIRKALTWFILVAFSAAIIAGGLGASITTAAPVR